MRIVTRSVCTYAQNQFSSGPTDQYGAPNEESTIEPRAIHANPVVDILRTKTYANSPDTPATMMRATMVCLTTHATDI